MACSRDFLKALLDGDEYVRQMTGHTVLPEEQACYAQTRRPLPRAIADILKVLGADSLYAHQAEAMDHIRAGHDVVVTTPTASGKTIIYNLPFLERRLLDPEATAIYLFPLKALAQDQKNILESLTRHWPEHARPPVALYDGDTPQHVRTKIRKNPPAVLITNPEMLHLGILPYHERWTTFLASLAFVVLDEAHIYRGVFGAHMAGVLRRLDRILARYNAHPAHVLCTATLGNPGQLGQLLLGLEKEPFVISKSGAPKGVRHMVFMNPDTSPSTLAIKLLCQSMGRGLRTIVYCRSRRMTELIALWASKQSKRVSDRISAYRAGYLPEERRQIEARMASGELLAVVSTSALELGIDIGNLDVCILVGYPGSIMSTMQRGGRVGRKGQESVVVLIGGEDALDQYFVRNPDQFFARPPESAMLNPDNPVILARHLECAAAESPLKISEPWLQRPLVRDCVLDLEQQGFLLRGADGASFVAARKNPQRQVQLRGQGTSFQIVDENGTVIGSVDAHQAFRETHPGAVYLHRGTTYSITKLDIGGHTAYAAKAKVGWHTNVRTTKSTEILSIRAEGMVHGMKVCLGKLRVTETITGYERRENATRRLLDILPLELPPQTFVTEGLWFCIPDEARIATEEQFYHFMGSIHAMEHISIALMPMLVMADRNDFGGISIPMHHQVGGPAVFVYDGLPGGAGLTAGAFEQLEALLQNVRQVLKKCPCETGCPSCIQSPKCGAGNRPLDKQGCIFLIDQILDAKGSTSLSLDGQAERILETGEQAMQVPQPEGQVSADSGETSPEGLSEAHPEARKKPDPAPAVPDAGKEPDAATVWQARKKEPQTYREPVMFFDVETRRSAQEVGGWGHADKMGVSVVVVWDGSAFKSFTQDTLSQCFDLLQTAGLVVGFNSFRFDYKVLQPFALFPLQSLNGLDMLEQIVSRLNYRLSLDNLANATLGTGKTGDGLKALDLWKEGKTEELTDYCRQDVALTRDLFYYGREHGFLLFTNKYGQKVRLPVSW